MRSSVSAAAVPAAALGAALLAAACGTESSPASIETFTSDAAGFDTHTHWLDTGREVIVFDAQFTEDLARAAIAQIQQQTQSPIRYVVVTHPNPDKFNGARAFQDIGATVIASERTAAAIPGVHAYKKYYFVEIAKAFTEATYPAQASVDLTFQGELELPLEGDAKVTLRELANAGVSSTQTVAWVPAAGAVLVGDLVHHRAHAWLEGGIVDGKPTPDLAAWKRALGELSAFGDATVYGGRGEPAAVAEAITAQQGYLDALNAIVTKYVADLGPAKSELQGPQAGEHYKQITARAAQAFPEYALPYLIEYGVYGLVNQIAAE